MSARFLVLAWAFFAIGAVGRAQSMTGDIVAVDVATGAISVAANGGSPRAYHTRPSVEVQINGKPGKFADLGVGMAVKVSGGEPGVATRLEASGTAVEAGGGEGLGAALEGKLIGTVWVWMETKTTYDALTFKANGVAHSSVHPRAYSWKVAPGGYRVEGATPFGKKFKIIFDPTLTKGRIFEGTDPPRDTRIVSKPAN